MAKKTNQSAKKKVDWKKIFTIAVVLVLIVLKLMYGNGDSEEDAGSQSAGNVVESSQSVDDTAAGDASLSVNDGDVLAESGQSTDSTKPDTSATEEPEVEIPDLSFRSEYLLDQHYEKHGIDMGFASAEEYETAACMVIANSETLHKLEGEDGDDVYYLESTNEFVVVSKDGYIRTYFLPDDGIEYYNRQ